MWSHLTVLDDDMFILRPRRRLLQQNLSYLRALQSLQLSTENKKHDQATDPEQGIHPSPEHRNFANSAKHDGKWQDSNAGRNPIGNDPRVADWVTNGHQERYGNDEVPESQPVVPIGQERVFIIGLLYGPKHQS